MSSKSTTKTTLALIPYLNCEPFYAGIEDLDYEIVHESPRELGKLAEKGMATCGPMALVDYLRLSRHFDLLGDFGIACEGPAHSVLLFAKREIGSLGGCRVGVTRESSTSVRLLEMLLSRKYALEGVTYSRALAEADEARLLIGDAALKAACEGLDDFAFVYDLGEEWHGWQALPFVFARWVVSKHLAGPERERISRVVAASLDSWRLRIPEIAARRGPEFDLDGNAIREYLSSFRYRIGPVEMLGQQTFESLLEESA
jgi:chorismate dehydratase